jgi:hypothetical protein
MGCEASAARNSWCESNDPEFAAKAADVVGLYIDPPAKTIVLCVDEKPSIQALERAQGYLKLPNGRALTGQSHAYKRHGRPLLEGQNGSRLGERGRAVGSAGAGCVAGVDREDGARVAAAREEAVASALMARKSRAISRQVNNSV